MGEITATIDGRQVKAKEGMTILEAARANGIDIPTLCYHQDLTPIGACRICVVEVEGSRTLVGSCHTPITEGMVIHTRSDKVLATRRSVKREGRARYIDVMLPADQLWRLLGESDFVVVSVPLTPETSKLIGEKELRTMKSTAYLINIARGGIVDEEALIRALEEKWIAGAGLDVFATEPLPPDSRLWELPNVILSPHISGGMGDYIGKATEVFLENLRRYLDGKRLHNIVNKKRGY